MSRIKPEQEIKYICSVIDKNIEAHKILKDRGLLSENILAQLRNLTEDLAIFINNKENALNLDTHYENVNDSMSYVSKIHKYRYITVFHKFLQSTVSHYTPSENDAERLMLFYFRYICMMKETLESFGIKVLKKLDDFPIYEDDLSKEHYQNIYEVVREVGEKENKYLKRGRFYINKCKPRYSNGKLYYEITLIKATNYFNKFERILMYSKYYIPDNYAIKLSYIEKEIELFSSKTKIKVIDNFVVSIRPCELKNLGKIFGLNLNISDEYVEYSNLMKLLKKEEINLLELILTEDNLFESYLQNIKENSKNNNITTILILLRDHLINERRGSNILRYILIKMDNEVIKDQLNYVPNNKLSDLYLANQSIPFDSMPYAMSLYNHNISWFHLISAISPEGRNFEILGRHVKNNCETNNILYTSCDEVERFGNVDDLIFEYNKALFDYGIDRMQKNILIKEYNNIYIKSYETTSIEIINKINSYKVKPNKDIIDSLENLKDKNLMIDLSNDKKTILKSIFRKDSIGIIHGPAGTGKTKLLEVLATIFRNYNKIILSNTNTSVENLRARISIYDENNSTFETISYYNKYDQEDYDILIIDECSTVSNDEMLKALKKQNYKLIILSGDVFQIESIKYGNWFSLSYNLFKRDFVYELMCTNRTDDMDLLELWKMIRDNDEHARNKMSNQEYSSPIDLTIFDSKDKDEIMLCLNYDGLYGINNMNKILQEKNLNKEYTIGVNSYKEEDPIVFNDCPRFKDLYNNLKGRIKKIEIDETNDCVWFTILVDEHLLNSDGNYEIIEYQENKTLIRIYVNNFKDTNEDDTGYEHIIPFNLAYAISIHKAQGLEYKSVKVIITSNIEDEITKNIFYTAITRTKKYLKVFWSSETQNKIFENMKKTTNGKDISLLRRKINIE